MNTTDSDMPMMQMYFNFGVDVTILFKFWHVTSWPGLLISCLVLCIVSVMFEGIKVCRMLLSRGHNEKQSSEKSENSQKEESSSTIAPITGQRKGIDTEKSPLISNTNVKHRLCDSRHCVQSLLYALQMLLAYCLMLVFMTYNVWLAAAVVMGAGLGHYLLAWKVTEELPAHH